MEEQRCMASYIFFRYIKKLWANKVFSMFQAYYNDTALILKWKKRLDWMMDNKTQLPYNQLLFWVLPVWILFLDAKLPLLM